MQIRFVWLFVICLASNPQKNIAQTTAINKTENKISYEYAYAGNSFVSNVPLNEISSKAFKHFVKNYSAITNEKWIKIPDGIVAIFTNDSVLNKIFYNRKGTFLYSYKYYDEKKCRVDLKKMVEQVYPQFHITCAIELFDGQNIVYGIKITNNEITRTLELNNGEIKILDEFQNQKNNNKK
jgi:hypothetical protein